VPADLVEANPEIVENDAETGPMDTRLLDRQLAAAVHNLLGGCEPVLVLAGLVSMELDDGPPGRARG
jgi:hypothetical protein